MNIENVATNTITKYSQLQKRVHEMEQEKSDIRSKLLKAQKHVKRLRMERLILLEQLDEYYTSHKDHFDASDSDDSGDSGTEILPYEMRLKQSKRKRSQLSDKFAVNSKKASSNKLHETSIPAPPRKKKDPNAPKGPGNVFFLYCRMEREHFKDELPTENLGEVTRLLGQKWKAMTDDEKKQYYDLYDKEQEEYQKAMKSYKESGGGDIGRPVVLDMNKDEIVDDGDVDIVQGEADVKNGYDDNEGNELFMDQASTATTDLPATIDPGVSNSITSATDSTLQWY